jgi:hypothetical protein
MGAPSSTNIGCDKNMGRDRWHSSLISDSVSVASVPGGLPRNPSKRCVMLMIGSIVTSIKGNVESGWCCRLVVLLLLAVTPVPVPVPVVVDIIGISIDGIIGVDVAVAVAVVVG